MKTDFLLLWLQAPLQSWGVDSRFGRRDSLDFPTKSGIAGLLLCALGASGEQEELLGEMDGLRQTAISFRAGVANERPEQLPMLRDFHMVGSRYDENNPWQSLHIPKTREGKKAVGGGTKMTFRYYLQDSFFAVVVEVPQKRANELIQALAAPVFDIYLGRKCCVPTDIVYRGHYETETQAVEGALATAKEKGLTEKFRAVDGEDGDDVLTLNDVPLRFGSTKKYRERKVAIIKHE